MFHIVRRVEIPAVYTVEVEGRTHRLGVLKDFRKDERLRAFVPPTTHASIAWVRLEKDEVLEVHTHPVRSLILVTEGSGRTLGDLEVNLSAGDAVLVPSGAKHGFVGTHDGFWGITVQFEPRGLYEDLDDPWVTFIPNGAQSAALAPLEGLLALNAELAERYAAHPVFALAKAGQLKSADARQRFVDCLSVWSGYFQKMLAARSEFTRSPEFLHLAQLHQAEEAGHDASLARGGETTAIFDPELEALSTWFVHQMAILGDVERTVLMHLVVEGAATIFYRQMASHLLSDGTREHFEQHAGVDERHEKMALEALRATHLGDCAQLEVVVQKGWAMMRALLARMGALALGV